ncbi:unnamed protein product [Leuciscus chuanchicus]
MLVSIWFLKNHPLWLCQITCTLSECLQKYDGISSSTPQREFFITLLQDIDNKISTNHFCRRVKSLWPRDSTLVKSTKEKVERKEALKGGQRDSEIFPLAAEGTTSPFLLQEKDLDAKPKLGFCSGKKSEMLNGG